MEDYGNMIKASQSMIEFEMIRISFTIIDELHWDSFQAAYRQKC